MKGVTFSIAVVCLNAGERLIETVRSILEQSYGEYEIIIKDGMSKDGSVEALPENKKIRIYREKDTGIYDAMNQAVEKAKGDYIFFLNCGDIFHNKEVLQRVYEAIAGRKETASGECIFYGDIWERKTGQRVSSNPHMDAFGCYRNVPCHQACFYAAKLLARRQFDTGYRVRADYEHFLWCFFQGGAETVYVPHIIADYEGGGFSETKENRKKSAIEHKEITARYMSKRQIAGYRLLMLATLAPLRTWLAENRTTARLYQRLKRRIYGK